MGPIEKILRDAWELIKDPKKRCAGVLARSKTGRSVLATNKKAVQWCSVGAVVNVVGKADLTANTAARYLDIAARDLSPDCPSVLSFNDADIIKNPPKLFKKAIRMAKEDKV